MSERDVELHLAFEGDAVSGHVETADGVRQPFASWLGLFSLLDAMAADRSVAEGWRSGTDPV